MKKLQINITITLALICQLLRISKQINFLWMVFIIKKHKLLFNIDWIQERKSFYERFILSDLEKKFKKNPDTQNPFELLSNILKKKDPKTGWSESSEIPYDHNDFILLKYLEEENIIVKRFGQIKLKFPLLEKVVEAMSHRRNQK